jgi:hypothetical protein
MSVSLSVHGSAFEDGDTLNVSWNVTDSKYACDKCWIGVFPSGAADTSYRVWSYITGQQSGSVSLVLDTAGEYGEWDVRYFVNGNSNCFAKTHTFTVTKANRPNVLLQAVPCGSMLSVTWDAKHPKNARNQCWIGAYRKSESSQNAKFWKYTGDTVLGSLDLETGGDGEWEVRYFGYKSSYIPLATVVTSLQKLSEVLILGEWTSQNPSRGGGPNTSHNILLNKQYHICVKSHTMTEADVTISLSCQDVLLNIHVLKADHRTKSKVSSFNHCRRAQEEHLIKPELVFPDVIGTKSEWHSYSHLVKLKCNEWYILIPGTWNDGSTGNYQLGLKCDTTVGQIEHFESETWKSCVDTTSDHYSSSPVGSMVLCTATQYLLTVSCDTNVHICHEYPHYTNMVVLEGQFDDSYKTLQFNSDIHKIINFPIEDFKNLTISEFRWKNFSQQLHLKRGTKYLLVPLIWDCDDKHESIVHVYHDDDVQVSLNKLKDYSKVGSLQGNFSSKWAHWANSPDGSWLHNPQLEIYGITQPNTKVFISVTGISDTKHWTCLSVFKLKSRHPRLMYYSEENRIGHNEYHRQAAVQVTLDPPGQDEKIIIVTGCSQDISFNIEVLVQSGDQDVKLVALDSREQVLRNTRKEDQSISEQLVAKYKPIQGALFEHDPVEEAIAMCQRTNTKFMDTMFVPDDTSLYKDRSTHDFKVASWERAQNMYNYPLVYDPVLGTNADEVMQGGVGNCWFISLLSTIAERQDIASELVKPNTFSPWGVYSVKVVIDSKVYYVLVDDYLPCDVGGQIRFAKTRNREFLWVALTEKCNAKMNGGYQCIDGDHITNCTDLKKLSRSGWGSTGFLPGYEDFTGGYSDLRKYMENGIYYFTFDEIWKYMLEYVAKKWMVVVSPPTKLNFHIPALLNAIEIGEFKLLKLRNPWGNTDFWAGDWSDESDMWSKHPKIAEMLQFSGIKDDGITWIDLKDIEVAAEQAGTDPALSGPWIYSCHTWEGFDHLRLFYGSLFANKNSRGNWLGDPLYPYAENPQYHLHISEQDTVCNITIKERDPRFFPGSCSYWIPVHVDIYQPRNVDNVVQHRKLEKITLHETVDELATSKSLGRRFRISDLKLDSGHYVLVVSANLQHHNQYFHKGEHENTKYEKFDYVLAVYSDKNVLVEEMN